MRRTIIALLLIVSGAAAAVAQTVKQNPSAQAPPKGHCAVGVISDLGEKFQVRNKDVPVEWHIDDLVVDRIRAALGKRAVVQRIPYRKDVEEQVRRSVAPTLFGAQFKELLRRLTTGTRCARYVVVTRASRNDDDEVGLGIVTAKSFGTPRAYVHVLITMRVYDGETFVWLAPTGLADSSHKVDPSFSPDPQAVQRRMRSCAR